MSFFGPQSTARGGGGARRFTLHQPVSIAVYDSYEDAQHAVDYLADQRFPVSNLSIVGTDLKSFERITGGLNWGKVILSAVLSGITWGILAGFFFKLFVSTVSLGAVLLGAVAVFVIANVISSSIGYAMTGGRRDFTSTTQVVATRYEILGEAPVANDARALLSGGGRQTVRRPQPPRGAEPDLTAFPPPAWPSPAPSPQAPGEGGSDPAGGQPGGSTGTPGAGRFDPTDRSQG